MLCYILKALCGAESLSPALRDMVENKNSTLERLQHQEGRSPSINNSMHLRQAYERQLFLITVLLLSISAPVFHMRESK